MCLKSGIITSENKLKRYISCKYQTSWFVFLHKQLLWVGCKSYDVYQPSLTAFNITLFYITHLIFTKKLSNKKVVYLSKFNWPLKFLINKIHENNISLKWIFYIVYFNMIPVYIMLNEYRILFIHNIWYHWNIVLDNQYNVTITLILNHYRLY